MTSTPLGRPSDVKRSSNARRTVSINRVEIRINVYDLLPPGRLSQALWNIGSSMLHSGVVMNGKEYAYGGHEKKGVSGVYWTQPGMEPPGGTFRCEILHGLTFRPQDEIDAIVRSASHQFEGPDWNLLTNNCNHFTNHLCQQLIGRTAPAWLNRAASIGVALPCVVPKQWLAPPDAETADGELVDESDGDDGAEDENASMLRYQQRAPRRNSRDNNLADAEYSSDDENLLATAKRRRDKYKAVKDSSGRVMPVSERAPPPHD